MHELITLKSFFRDPIFSKERRLSSHIFLPFKQRSRTFSTKRKVFFWKFWPKERRVLGQFPPWQLPPGQLPPGQLPPKTIAPRQSPPRTIVPRTIRSENFHLELLYCPRIVRSRLLLSRVMKIVECYYPVTLTKRSQLCKAKQFFKKIWLHKDNRQHRNKTDKFFPRWQLYVES